MNRDIALTVDRVQRSRAEMARRYGDRLLPWSTVTAPSGGALEVGARVFDLVTGQEGEIVGRTTENILIQPAAERKG